MNRFEDMRYRAYWRLRHWIYDCPSGRAARRGALVFALVFAVVACAMAIIKGVRS